ncbi:MAG: zinc ribbon domain-containing protein [Pseudomonadota bacterium]
MIAHSISPCCMETVKELPEATFCTRCGKPLKKCMAFDECGSLLTPEGHCPVCLDLKLALDAGSAAMVREGGRLALPLILKNTSSAGRPIFINDLWVREDEGGTFRKIDLDFERLDVGPAQHLGIRTGELNTAGIHMIELLISVSMRYMWREERFIFSSRILFPVEPKDPGGPQTNININADQIGQGFTLYNPTEIEQKRAAGQETHIEPVPLELKRADARERNGETRCRGYENGLVLVTDPAFDWFGFAPGSVVENGPSQRTSGLIIFGRNAVNLEKGANDACLVVYENGAIDERSTMSISRHLFTMYPENGRLMLRVDGQFGIKVNDKSLNRTNTTELYDGDVIYPLKRQPDDIALHINFDTERKDITRVRIRRTPAAPVSVGALS